MFSKLVSAAAVGLTYLTEESASYEATATFDGSNGIEGTVVVDNGYLTIALNLSGASMNGFADLPGNTSCFAGDGFSYHIHEFWNFNDSTTEGLSSMCGSDYTGGHWDPWLACGGATGNELCSSKGGCINGSSAYDGSDGYNCGTTSFDVNAYTCEVGDWSGKYGKLALDMTTYGLSLSASSPFEVDGDDVQGMSVVFHCNDGSRAFCAAFDDGGETSTSRPVQADDGEEALFAVFEDVKSTVSLYARGNVFYNYVVFLQTGEMTIPSDCGDELLYRIYNSWESDSVALYGDDCTSAIVGNFYDPTISCAYDSDSVYCKNGTLCDEDVSYSCDASTASDRFDCAPGDLSGKYGTCSSSSDNCTMFGTDDLLIDLALITDRSLVIQCSDTYEILACASFVNNETAQEIFDNASDSDDAMPVMNMSFSAFIVLVIGNLLSLLF